MKLAILSDTHGLLRPQVVERLKTADAILHGGDINRQDIVDQLEQYAPLYVVRGNNDKQWAEAIPHDLSVTLDGVTFYMVHNKKEVPADLSGVDVVVFGHSHKYVQEEKNGVLWLNPGSCGPRRFHQEITMMMAEVFRWRRLPFPTRCRDGAGPDLSPPAVPEAQTTALRHGAGPAVLLGPACDRSAGTQVPAGGPLSQPLYLCAL